MHRGHLERTLTLSAFASVIDFPTISPDGTSFFELKTQQSWSKLDSPQHCPEQ
jgi:hypothetical protein